MTHINEIVQVLDSIIACGESMARLGGLLKESIPEFIGMIPQKTTAEPAAESEPTPAALPEKEEAPALKAYTFTDVRKAFSAKSHAGFTAQVKELIGKYGAERLSDVREEDYAALMADLEVIG